MIEARPRLELGLFIDTEINLKDLNETKEKIEGILKSFSI